LLTIVVALLAVSINANGRDFSVVEQEFNEWTIFNDKHYDSEIERVKRLAIYNLNTQRVYQLNAQSEGNAVFTLNKFADLTANEFKQKLGYVAAARTEEKQTLTLTTEAVPSTYSWITQGKVTAVKNQEQCGSCWAFSATENIESVWMIAHGLTPSTMKPLAPQQIVDCDKSDGGCNGGDTTTAFDYVKNAGGMDTEASYPYRAVNEACHFKEADVFSKITGYKYATTTKNEDEMKTATATVAPLSICVDAEPWQFYTSGVMTKAQCGTSLDHCVQITGYDTAANPPYWEVRNSWGADWGEKGFIRLEYGTNTCGLAEEATTATV
jgi:C1A family cysteine protease